MNHNIITTSSMIQNRDKQFMQVKDMSSASERHSLFGTLLSFLTAITMLFSLGIQGAWADTTVLWNFSDAGWTAGTAKNGLTPGSGVTFDTNSKSIDGYSFTNRLKLGGTMDATHCVSFAVTGACSIKVYGMSSSNTSTAGTYRTLKIVSGTSDGTVVKTGFLSSNGAAIGSDTYNYTGGAATLFIGSENSGYNLYAIKVTYADAPTTIPQTATWNFCEAGSAITAVGAAEGSSKVYPSDITGVTLSVDATNGKFAPRGTDVQVGAETIIKIPVVNVADVITITNYSASANNATYTIGEENGEISAQSKTYSPSATEVSTGYVVMTIKTEGYMRSISVVQNVPAGGDPELNITKTSTTLTARPLSKTVTDNVKLTGKNLTAGTVITPALSSAVTGLSISPTSTTVAANGTVDETFTITYAATADVSESNATYTFSDATDDKSVTCDMTYSATVTQTAQTSVSEATTWTWNDIYKQQIELARITNPSIGKTTEINFADLYPYVNTNANFNASALKVKANYPVYGNSSDAYFHGNQIKFTTTVAGKVKITKFASGGGDERSITINGTNVGSSTGTSDYITTATEVSVEAGEVTILGSNEVRIWEIVFTPSAPTPSYTALDAVKTATAAPFGFATASNRTTEGTTAVTGGGMHDIDAIMTALGDYTAGTSKTVNGKNVIVLQSDGTEMASTVFSAITSNDIIIFDGNGTSKDFVIGSVMKLNGVSNKTILGINGARLCTEWYLKDTDKAAITAAGYESANKNGGGGTVTVGSVTITADEEAELITRQTLCGIYSNENYKNAGVFEFYNGSNIIIRNIQFVGPGSVDVGGYDLLGFKNMTNSWVDHCEFTDGIDGNFDITEQSNFVTVSWCKFSYTERSYVHQNTNLVGGSDSKPADENKLNITFAYNQWGAGCNARMPMARYGKIHLINNYYTCVGNGTSCVNPRTQSEVLLDANHWVSGIKKIFEPGTDSKAPTAYTWSNTNVIKDASPSKGAPASDLGTVTVPYDYSALMLDPETLPTVIPANGGAILYGTTPVVPVASDLAVADGKGTVSMTVGDADKALVKGTDYTTSSTGAVTLSSSDEAVATIVDGKIHAVAAGSATITISQAADTNYEAGEAEVTVNVTAAENTETKKLYEFSIPTAIPTEASHIVDYVGEFGTATTTYTYDGSLWALDTENGSYLRYSSGNAKLTVTLPTGMKFEEGDIIKYTYQDQSTSKITYPIFKSNTTSASVDGEKDATVGDRGEHTASIVVGTGIGQLNIVGESSFNVERGGGGTVDLKALSVEREVSTEPELVETTLFSWDGTGKSEAPTAVGGTLSISGTATQEAQKGNFANKFANGWTVGTNSNYVKIALTESLKAGDVIHIGAFITTSDNAKYGGINVFGYTSDDDAQIANHQLGTTENVEVLTSNGTPTDQTMTVTDAWEGFKYIVLSRNGNTGTFLSKVTITGMREVTPTPEPTPTVNFEPFKIDFRVKASGQQLYTVTLPDNGELPACVTINNVVIHDNQHGAKNGTSLTVHVDGPTKFTIGGCNYGNTVSVKVGSADAVAVDNKTATCDNGGDALAGLSYDNNVTYKYEGTKAADITFSLGSGAYLPYLFAEAIVTDWTPTWNETASRWEVKKGETDAENGESLIAALDYVKSQTNKTLFIPNGTYDLGATAKTPVNSGMHLIGESQDGVIIKNQLEKESINATATLYINKGATDVVLDNMTIKCRAKYGTGDDTATAERGVCVQDEGRNTTYNHVTLDGLQDTYYSNGDKGMTATFNDCIVRGNVDFFCGSGDITVNNSRLQIVPTHSSGGTAVICAPATYTDETQGYLFNNCVVEATTGSIDCMETGHSSSFKYALARGWYAGNGTDRSPAVTFKDTEFNLMYTTEWNSSIGKVPGQKDKQGNLYEEGPERLNFKNISTGPDFSAATRVVQVTNKPFAFATATDRTDTNSVSESNITGGGVYSIEDALALWDNSTYNETVTASNGKKVIVLQSDGKDVTMDAKITSAINNNDIILFDGGGTNGTDFMVHKYMTFKDKENKTILGINGARLCTEWFLTERYRNLLDNVPTSSGTGVNTASTATGTGGTFTYKNGKVIEIKEEGEYLTRKTLYEADEEKYYKAHGEYLNDELYRDAGIFYFGGCRNFIIRNLKFVGPGSIDVGGNDLVAIIDTEIDSKKQGSKHFWVDHCEFTDGIDGNMDITNQSDFITVSWCKFSYTERAYAHQNTNLVGSDDSKTEDHGQLNITFAYNQWGENCRSRMPMARYGKIHMLNNYYNCAGNTENAINPRIESEFLIEGNYFEKGVRNVYKENGSTAVLWQPDNIIMDKTGLTNVFKDGKNVANKGGVVTVPYQYMLLDANDVPETLLLNGGAVLGSAPTFTTNLGAADSDKTAPYEIDTKLSDFQKKGKYEDGLVLSVWADNAHTFQWFKAEVDEEGNVGEYTKVDGANRSTLTYIPTKGETVSFYCMAYGLAGSAQSDILKVTTDGESKPIYALNLDDEKLYEVTTGSPQIFTVNAGTDGVTYQWYKSANADGSVATAITNETGMSYTYNPSEAEVTYIFCRAHNAQGDTDSKIVKVRGTNRTVKFHMYATFDANANNSSVYVVGGTSNIDGVGTTAAHITSDNDGCKAEVNRTKDIPGLRFENTSTSEHEKPLGIYAEFAPEGGIAVNDKIEVSINTSSASSVNTDYGFYVCKAATVGTDNANVIGTINVNGYVLKTETFTATETLTRLYLIPFVGGKEKNINLANVVIYSGDIQKPVDAPAFTKDLEETYEVSQNGTLELEVDYIDSDISTAQWYKGIGNTAEGGTAIPDATGKKLTIDTSELGISYYYCVLTGKDEYDETTVASVSTKVVVKTAPTSFVTYTYDMKSMKDIASGEKSLASGVSVDVPSVEDPDGHIITYVPKDDKSQYNLSGYKFADNYQTYGYVKLAGSTSKTGNYYTVNVDNDNTTIKIYAHGGGDTERGVIVFNNLNSIPTKDNAIYYLETADGKKKDAYGETGPLNKGTYYVGVTNSSYIYAILVTEPEAVTEEKAIVHYRMDDESYEAKKELQAELGKIYFGANNRQTNGTASGLGENAVECGYAFRLGNNAGSGNTHYIKIIMPDGMPIQDGDVIKIKSWEDSGTPSGNTVGYRILSSNEGGTNSEYGILPCTVKGSEEEITATVSSTVLANLIGQSEFYLTRCDGKTVFMSEITITREMKAETECSKPVAKKGTWNATDDETWNYTISSSTPTAVIHYQVNDGEKVVASVAPKNTVNVALKPGDKVKAWATDSQSKIDNSQVYEFTVAEKAKLTKPTITIGGYSIANKSFPVTITAKAEEGATIYYTTDGSEPTNTSTQYTAAFNNEGGMTIKAIAIKDHWTNSDIVEAAVLKFESVGTEKIIMDNGSTSKSPNTGLSYTVEGDFHAGTYSGNSGTGIKYNVGTVGDQKNIIIKANDGFVIRKIESDYAVCNYDDYTATLAAVYADGDNAHDVKAATDKPVVLAKKGGSTSTNIATVDGLKAKSLDLRFTSTEGWSTKNPSQLNIRFIVYYELDDEIATEGENIVTVNGTALTTEQMNTLKTTGTVEIPEPIYAEDPVILMKSKLGYTYSLENKAYDPETKYNSFQKTFLDNTYTVKVKVNDMKSPSITIDEDFTVAGGYKVTLGGYSNETTPYINIDGKKEADGETLKWEVYDPTKDYYALHTVLSKITYNDGEDKETEARKATCPSNPYEGGKPFAIYVRQPSYLDTQDGSNPYNSMEPEAKDKIYNALKKNYNVIDFVKASGTEVLNEMPDIAKAKLVVITEMISGGGSYNMNGKDTKSTALAMTLKRDVVDMTNVINFKMFTYSQSKNNTDRWAWAQPASLPSAVVSIVPDKPQDGGMYAVFADAMLNRDGSITLWEGHDANGLLNHLQPVFNFREASVDEDGNPTETLPTFTPLAYAYDPDNQDETYHALHYYEKNGVNYVGFGLSVNDWTHYGDNIEAIVGKIGEMIKDGTPLNSKLEGIVDPKIADNGDGSATVINNNLNATTYYKAYTVTEAETLGEGHPTKEEIISGNVKPNDDFNTVKYTEEMVIFAVSEYNGAMSEIVKGSVKGSNIRYVIRQNDDPEAKGTVAKFPFTVNSEFKFPYNQSWSKDGETVRKWIAENGTEYIPGQTVSGLTQDIVVKAQWTKNTKSITDLTTESAENRTVTWQFLQSEGAPAVNMEDKAGNMQAILVGQVHFSDGTWIDIPMTINTDHSEVLPDNGNQYHGKFNNTSYEIAKANAAQAAAEAAGTTSDYAYINDYAQVRTGTQFTFPAVYGMQVTYKPVGFEKKIFEKDGSGNTVEKRELSHSFITQSMLTDGTLTNAGLTVNNETGAIVLSNGAVQFNDENKADNLANGGKFSYTGEQLTATLTSIESAVFAQTTSINPATSLPYESSKTVGTQNINSVFMQSLSVTYPALLDLTCTWVAVGNGDDPDTEKSKLDPTENPGKIEKLNDAHANCNGRYVIGDKVELKLTPSYGYYVDKDNDVEKDAHDVVTKKAYYFLKDGKDAKSGLNLGEGLKRYCDLDADGKTANDAKPASDPTRIPVDGAIISMDVTNIDLYVSMKQYELVEYNVEAYPSTQGYITFNTGNGRPHDDEYEEFPIGKKFYVTAHPNTGYKFKEWRRNTGDGDLISSLNIPHITFGDGVMVNPFDKNDYLETNELMFIAGIDNYGNNNDFTYVAVFEKAKTGTGYYEFNYALLQTEESEMTPIEVTDDDKNQFPSEFTSQLLNFPKCYTLFKPGYTLDHWVEISGTDTGEGEEHVFTPTQVDGKYQFGKPYNPGSYYNFETEGEIKHLVPVFKKNPTSYDYRATSVDITWDLRVAERAQRVNFKSGTNGNTAADTKIYYSTHAKINNGVLIDVPLTVTLGKKGKLVNDIEEEDKWCAMGEGTTIQIPSGLGAKFTIASLSKMETTTIDGVVPTSYTVENIDGADVYLYTFTTESKATSVTLKIGDDYTYYKYIRAELPAADAVPLTVTENNAAFGTVEISAARTTAENQTDNQKAKLLADIKATRVGLTEDQGDAYTLGLGTIVSLHAKREHLYVLNYFEDTEGNRYSMNKQNGTLVVTDKDGKDITDVAKEKDPYLDIKYVQDFNKATSLNDIELTFQVQSYEESMHAVFKENVLYQVNYTSGKEAEGEAPGIKLIEAGESFTVPAENHYLYVDGHTLKYWVDERGNKYDFGQTYTLGADFKNTTGKTLPSGIANNAGFTVPKEDLFLTPYFEINEFTVLNIPADAGTPKAVWPLTRLGKSVQNDAAASYDGNDNVTIYYQKSYGVYVTPLKITEGTYAGKFIDLKLDMNGAAGKIDNRTQGDRCQINGSTVITIPASPQCELSLYTVNGHLSTTTIGGTKITSSSVSGSNEKGTFKYSGTSSALDIEFAGEAGYFYQIEGVYKPVSATLPELEYVTIGNIALGAVGSSLADKNFSLSTLKKNGTITAVPVDLSASLTGNMPQVKALATNSGRVEVTQATIDSPIATLLLKTKEDVTVAVYKIPFNVTLPIMVPIINDVKVSRMYQCDLNLLDEDREEVSYKYGYSEESVDKTTYKYIKKIENAGMNGTITLRFNNIMQGATLTADNVTAIDGKKTIFQTGNTEVTSDDGQTLIFPYWNLALDTEYKFIIKKNTLKDTYGNKYPHDILLWFHTSATTQKIENRVINFVVTHNQTSKFNVGKLDMEAEGDSIQVASNELIKNLETAGIKYGTLDYGVSLANNYKGADRFYIFVPDGEYQLMGNNPIEIKYASGSNAPADNDGNARTEVIYATNGNKKVQNGITAIKHDNISITGQSQENTRVWNKPFVEGMSYTSTIMLNQGISGFYAQDMTLENKFDYKKSSSKQSIGARGVVLWDRSIKPVMKNVTMLSYQDTYYTNSQNQTSDSRGYYEDCTFSGNVDFLCGDGDHWFERCNLMVRAGKGNSATCMMAPRQYDTQEWGFVLNNCRVIAEDNAAFNANNTTLQIARPWSNSPALSLLHTTFEVLPTVDGYKAMSETGNVLRMHEFRSKYPDGTYIDLSERSLRNSSPGPGSYDAVMTPSEAARYNIYDAWGGADGYDPTIYTRQVNMSNTNGIKQDDTFLTWDNQNEALCYFLFTKDNESDTDWKLFAVTADTEFEMGNEQINKWFCVRAANQRGGLGEPTEAFQYKAHESYKRELIDNAQVINGWRWSTIYLDFDAKAPVVQHQKMVDGVPAVDANDKPVMEDEIYVYALVKVDATKLTFKRVKTMEKNCGYLIKARPRPEEYEFKYTEKTPLYHNDMTVADYVKYRNEHKEKDSDPDIQMPHMSLMNGSVTDKLAAGTAGYTLTSKTSYGLGFYKFVGKTYNANYAWLDAALVAEAQKALADGSLDAAAKEGFMMMVFDDDYVEDDNISTDINGIHEHQSNDDNIYNLSGQRINASQMQRGQIYIINGKKIKK